MVKLQIINKENVKKIPQVGGGEEDTRPIKGERIYPELYPNVFVFAKKNSGKSTIVWHMIKSCATKETTVIIFSSSVFKDAGYINMRKLLKQKDISCLAYNSFNDGDVNRLTLLVEQLQEEAEERENENLSSEEEEQDDEGVGLFDSGGETDSENEPKKKRKNKWRSPEYILVLDDISSELKSSAIVSLLKMNRHFHIMTIISSQYYMDLKPESRQMIDLYLILPAIPEDKIAIIHKDSDTPLSFEEFYKLYKMATQHKYNFFYVSVRQNEYRFNFSKKILIDN